MHRLHGRSAVLLALLVTFLWSTSWVLIKWGLKEIPPLTFAGLRYAIAACVLLPGLWQRRDEVRTLTRADWLQLGLLGLVLYALTQGGQFLALKYLAAIPFSTILSFTPILVAGASILILRERPSRLQWGGLALALVGAGLYFGPANPFRGVAVGFLFAGLTLVAGTFASLLGRAINRRRSASPIVVTSISMTIGAAMLLGVGLRTQGLPAITLQGWGIICWLAVVNTALAFTIWNRTLQVMSATESSVINNTMLVQVAILAWIFLGERPGALAIVGLAAVAIGTALVQLRRARRPREA